MLRKSHPLLRILNSTLVDLPTPSNISSFWNYGSLLGLTLIIQLLTGILLATRYSSHSDLSFDTLINLVQDSSHGWLLRLLHSTGASFFFLFIYLHIGRGIYYGSYTNHEVWSLGTLIYILLMATAFLGYVLPWGQISYWAATVITNLLSAVPYVGPTLVQWLWGGFSVNTYTLTRFFALHYFLPFLVTFLVALHIFYLHTSGSSNPLGISSSSSKVPFHYYHSTSDLLGYVIFLFIYLLVSFTYGYTLIDPENFIPANPLQTPTHIQPEWYFLFAYAILRSIPSNLGGVLALLSSICILFLIPLINPTISSGVVYSPILRLTFWSLVTSFLLLTWLGSVPAEPPYISVSLICTLIYFLSFSLLIFLPRLFP